jgi:hypothetical protein
MKKFHFKNIFAILLIFASTLAFSNNYEKTKKGILIPDHSKIQYAGSMGIVSASVGWNYWDGKLETDYYIGYLPQRRGFNHNITTSLEQTYIPWFVENSDGTVFSPIITGIYINRVFGSDYYTELPSKYPDKYYWWSSAVRINFFVGSRIMFQDINSHFPDIGLFTRFNTNDLYLVSAFDNESIKWYDIIKFSFGCYLKF